MKKLIFIILSIFTIINIAAEDNSEGSLIFPDFFTKIDGYSNRFFREKWDSLAITDKIIDEMEENSSIERLDFIYPFDIYGSDIPSAGIFLMYPAQDYFRSFMIAYPAEVRENLMWDLSVIFPVADSVVAGENKYQAFADEHGVLLIEEKDGFLYLFAFERKFFAHIKNDKFDLVKRDYLRKFLLSRQESFYSKRLLYFEMFLYEMETFLDKSDTLAFRTNMNMLESSLGVMDMVNDSLGIEQLDSLAAMISIPGFYDYCLSRLYGTFYYYERNIEKTYEYYYQDRANISKWRFVNLYDKFLIYFDILLQDAGRQRIFLEDYNEDNLQEIQNLGFDKFTKEMMFAFYLSKDPNNGDEMLIRFFDERQDEYKDNPDFYIVKAAIFLDYYNYSITVEALEKILDYDLDSAGYTDILFQSDLPAPPYYNPQTDKVVYIKFNIIKAAIEYSVDEYNKMVNLGMLMYRFEKYDKAITLLQKAIKLDSLDYTTYETIGDIYFFKLLDTLQANSYFEQSLEKGNDDIALYYKLASSYLLLDNYKDAEKHYSKVMELNPDFANSYNQYSYIMRNNGKIEELISLNEHYLENIKDTISVYPRLAYLYFLNKEYEKAELFYDRYLEQDTSNIGMYNDFAWILVKSGRKLDKALQLVSHALKAEPDNIFYNGTLGKIYLEKGFYDDAIEFTKKALEGNIDKDEDEQATDWEQIGDAYFHIGEYELALEAFRESIKWNDIILDNFSHPYFTFRQNEIIEIIEHLEEKISKTENIIENK